MDKKNCHIELGKKLDEELRHSRSLLSVLKEESIISHKEADKLLSISEQKNTLLIKLEQLHASRNSLIQTFGFGPDHQGMESCIAWCDHNQQLINKWTSFLQLVTECRSANQLNGSTMDSSLRTVKQALAILYGQQLNENTYNANGQEQASNMGRSIAKA
jgi:flagella synthesis protein FlgN